MASTDDEETRMMAEIGERFRSERTWLALSQEDAAKICGVTSRTIISWEGGAKIPSHKLAKIVAAGADGQYILTGQRLRTSHDRTVVQIEDAPKEKIKEWLDEFWTVADAKRRNWLEMQIEDHLPQYREWRQKNEGGDQDCDTSQGGV